MDCVDEDVHHVDTMEQGGALSKPIYLYITPYFPSPESWRGGYSLDAAKAIMHDGRYDVRVMVAGNGDDYEWDGLEVSRFRRIVAPCGLMPFLLCRINNRLFRHRLETLGIDPNDVAVCHVNTLPFGQYAAFFKRLNPRTKAIIQIHFSYGLHLTAGRLGALPLHSTFLYFYYRRICESVDALVFVSKMCADTFGKRFVGNPEGEVKDVRSQLWFGRFIRGMRLPRKFIVYNGIDKKLFSSLVKEEHDGFVIGCVANFQPFKDHITLLKAVNILKDRIDGLKVRLIGSGETLQSCKKYAADNALDSIVSFEQEIDHRDLPRFYRSLDLFVLPSRLEGFVCVCVESWACGTPTIFSRTISLSELVSVEEQDKWLFSPTDAHDLASKILAYRDNRWQQHFTKDLEINSVWRHFLDGVDTMESHSHGSSMRIAVLWPGFTGYTGLCWQELSKRNSVKILLESSRYEQEFDGSELAGLDWRRVSLGEIDGALEEVRAFRPDAVLVCGWSTPLSRAACTFDFGCRKIFAFDMPWEWSIRKFSARWLLRSRLKSFDSAFVPGTRTFSYAQWLGFKGRVATGLNPSGWERFSAKSPSTSGFLFVGRLTLDKGLDVLVKAYARYREMVEWPWAISIVGSGEFDFPNVEGLRVVGFVQPARMPDVMGEHAALVLPSRWEPWGIAALEAMSAGLATIASEACGFTDDVEPTVKVKCEDVESLAKAMAQIHGMSVEEREAECIRAKRLAEKYSAQKWCERLERLTSWNNGDVDAIGGNRD